MVNVTHTVSEITSYISHLFSNDEVLNHVWVSGEVSNVRHASSGHWYFTLKDSDAQLRCVMWRGVAARQQTQPKEGDALAIFGSIGVYEPRGQYQMYVEILQPAGVGDLYQEFERLKAKLNNEGLFEAERKREPPLMPHKIGVVTSPEAAAFQDILNVLRRRYPLAEVILSPTMVQGAEAPPKIVQAIERLNDHTDVDVILLCRGGGSIEDLWAFNDENVARAVVASCIPIISGVGHETDFTIVDFVSDVRAPTPSAAAELAVPSIIEMKENLADRDALLISTLDDMLMTRKQKLADAQRSLGFHSPQNNIRTYRQRIDEINARLTRSQYTYLRLLRERIQSRTSALHAADPKALLARGYAIVVRKEDQGRVTSKKDAPPGTEINIQLSDGEVEAQVKDYGSDGQRRYQRTLL